MKTDKEKLIELLEELSKLFDENILIRNTDNDNDFKRFTEEGFRITNTLSGLYNILVSMKSEISASKVAKDDDFIKLHKEDIKVGDKVKFVEASDEQVKWGSNDDPRKLLIMGAVYEVNEVEVHSWHTKIYLKGIEGKFNSAHFEVIKEETKEPTLKDELMKFLHWMNIDCINNEEMIDEYLKKQPIEHKPNERYFSDPDGKGWPDLEDDCAPD